MSEAPRFVVKRSKPAYAMYGTKVRDVPLMMGLPSVDELATEFEAYVDVLMGRVDPPVDAGVMTLMECADAFFARACEVDALIHKGEREGDIFRGAPHYKFRTGELRSYLDLFKRSAELGSRRLTLAQLHFQERR